MGRGVVRKVAKHCCVQEARRASQRWFPWTWDYYFTEGRCKLAGPLSVIILFHYLWIVCKICDVTMRRYGKHIINTGTGIGEKFPPFPLFIYVSLILPMIATNCQCPCSAKRSSAVMCQKKRYTLQILPEPHWYLTVIFKNYILNMPLKSFTLSKNLVQQ